MQPDSDTRFHSINIFYFFICFRIPFKSINICTCIFLNIVTFIFICRYVAIVHPIKAHILCSKKRILIAIGCIWPVAILVGLPTLLFNTVKKPHAQFPVELCFLSFPANHVR